MPKVRAGLCGVFPVLVTPFSESDEIDVPSLRREIDWVFNCGAAGVTVAMVSEILRIDHAERRALAQVVCDASNGRGPVIISVGAESTSVAVRLAEHAQLVGASAVMAIPPLSVAPPAQQLADYFGAILDAVELPLIVQDSSAYVGDAIPTSLLAGLHDRHGERIYFKPEAEPLGPRLSALLKATSGAARSFDGSGGAALVDTYRRGIVGAMPGADVCWAITRIWNALQANDYETAYQVSLPLSALLAIQRSLDGYVGVEKHLLVKQGVIRSSVCRGPLDFDLDDLTILQADTVFGFLEATCRQVSSPQPT